MAARTKLALSPEVLDVLGRSAITDTTLKLPDQMERKLYEAVNKIIVAAGGRWNRGKGCHVFASDPRELLGMAVATGEIVHKKNLYQSFYTPAAVADEMVDYAGSLHPWEDVLEPSAGHGAIAEALVRRGHPRSHITCLDIDPEAVAVLQKAGYNAERADFLTWPGIHDRRFSRVFMNPPFTGGQDIAHVTHAMRFLLPGGRLCAIMSPTWQTSDQRAAREFRERVGQWAHSVTALPAGSFRESGTDVATVMLVVSTATE